MIPPDTCLMIGWDGMGYTPRKNVVTLLTFFTFYFSTHGFVRFSGTLRVTTCYYIIGTVFFERCTYGAVRRIYLVRTGVG